MAIALSRCHSSNFVIINYANFITDSGNFIYRTMVGSKIDASRVIGALAVLSNSNMTQNYQLDTTVKPNIIPSKSRLDLYL